MFDRPYERACEVQFSDLDINGQVHHLAYLRYAEAARVNAFADLGAGPAVLVAAGRVVVVLSMDISFVKPLCFGEAVRATATYQFGSGKSFRCNQRIYGADAGEAAHLDMVLGLMDTRAGRLVEDPLASLRDLVGGD
ncbi:acyl-CoA thioesterase [Mycobacterium neglectum]|uniref:acyl-CoA thioesterase n=1 Tax=Mycobacterium neglectum TaxID=242737 RepID=UPI000BFEBE39|nr:acyl-CoA thioesterase [Mycobacterium neglectum]